MNPLTGDQLAQALTSGGSAWMVFSVAGALPLLWAFALSMHFARPYIVRFLGSLTLRFGADVWWLSYVLARDALLLVVFTLSVIFLMPNLYIGLGLPLTAPLATVALFWALIVKLTRDVDDNPAAYRLFSILLVVASVLYIVPQVYGLESADQATALGGVGLGGLADALSAVAGDGTVNALAWPILWLSLALFAASAAFLFGRFMLALGREPKPAGSEETTEAAAGAAV